MDKINVIKVGGAVVEDAASLSSLLDSFALLPGKKVLVHGGGRSATAMAAELGIESQMVQGRRITDDSMLRIVQMVYGGLVNKNIVAGLQARQVNAIGLTGADMNVMHAHKRPLKKVSFDDGHQEEIDFGWVGDVDSVDGKVMQTLIESGAIPVMAPLTHDGEGHMLNTNADTIAAETAKALSPYYDVTLTYCFEKAGVLSDAEREDSVIPVITSESFARLKAEGVVNGGMIPKLENALDSISKGVKKVVITHISNLDGSRGTSIV